MSSEIGPGQDTKQRIYLVPHPKIVFMYPSLFVAIIAGFVSHFSANHEVRGTHVMGLLFLVVLGMNLSVMAFDFPRTTSLTVFFALAAAGIGAWFFFTEYPEAWPAVHDVLKKITPFANARFYFLFSVILGLLFVGVWVNTQFDFWEVRPNELLHHHGIWANMERFAAPSLRIDKEINDLLEYLLLGSGRLVLHPSDERRAIVLDNVFFVNRKEAQLTKLLGALQVEVKTDNT
jgi:hypothetical protein